MSVFLLFDIYVQVLKTKGYIQVKQELAYEDIHLYPSPKLMKTTF
jgi:hypothetical protein